MSATPASQELRRRASVLRSKAQQLDLALLHVVSYRAGPETWIGPTADHFVSALLTSVNDVDSAIDEIRVAVRTLERRADQVEAAAAIAAIPSGGPR